MNRIKRPLIRAMAAGALLLPGFAPDAQVLDTYTGAELFEQFCASCHGPAGRGDGPVASALDEALPDLTRLSANNGGAFPEDYVRAVIDGRYIIPMHGTRYMPVWGFEFWVMQGADVEASLLVEVIMSNLMDYLESIQDARPELQP